MYVGMGIARGVANTEDVPVGEQCHFRGHAWTRDFSYFSQEDVQTMAEFERQMGRIVTITQTRDGEKTIHTIWTRCPDSTSREKVGGGE